jgi:hypothetical protein
MKDPISVAENVVRQKIAELCAEVFPHGKCVDVAPPHIVGIDGTTLDGHYCKLKFDYQFTYPDDPINVGWTRYRPK